MVLEYSSFSNCGNFYAHCGIDGKLKIWETVTGTFKQEYTPNLHLTSPYTCLTWLYTVNASSHQKKKRKSDGEGGSPLVAMGTQAGAVVLYSVAEGTIISTLSDGHKSAVTCLAWQRNADLFSCTSENFVHWDVANKAVRSKWKNGETCSAMAVSKDGEMLVTAARSIKWWSVPQRTVVKTFTGHASPVVRLLLLSPGSGDSYVISAAQNDRLVNAWCLNSSSESSAVSSFLVSDLVQSLSVNVSKDGCTNLVVVTLSGTLHLYSHQLNGKCGKPLKPKLSMMIASDTGQSKTKVPPLNIIAAHLHSQLRAQVVYGQVPFLAFETVKLDHPTNELCLVRKDPKINLIGSQEAVSKVRVPESTSKDVQYLSGTVMNGALPLKRGRSKESEVPMEERLENLALHQPSSSSQPNGEGMAHLLLQGLQSKDKSLLHSVLFRRDEAVIAQTVQRLPVKVISPLVKELTVLLQGKTISNQIAAVWLKCLLAAHAGQLLADPAATAAFSPLLGLVETRLSCLAPLARLRGRLDLLLHQVSFGSSGATSLTDSQAIVVHQDQDSTEEGSDTFGSDAEEDESEDRWDELSDDEAEMMESEDVELSS